MKASKIYSELKKHARVSKSFHVPGHKAARAFKSMFPVADIDVTELSYSDNLACPEGVIAEAENDIAGILGVNYSYLITDGATCGIMVMMYAASKQGRKIIMPRNSHESVWNACRIMGLEPVVVQGPYKDGVITPPEPDELENLLREDESIAGMICVSPDYYGNIAPLEKYSGIMHKYGRLLLVDEAHGAYLGLEKSPDYAGNFADIWTDGAHKTLPTLTQGAILSLNDEKLLPVVEEGLSIFRTSSPSYPIMASVEYGVKYLAENREQMEEARKAAEDFRADQTFSTYPGKDWTKLVIDCSSADVSADLAEEALEKKGIYPELSDGRYLLFYLSPMTTAKDLSHLKAVLSKILSGKKLKGTYEPRPQIAPVARTYSYQYAVKRPSEYVLLSKAEGRMAATNAGITPPCIPLVIAGEKITREHIAILSGAHSTFGLVQGRILVVKNQQ
ncbi:MAG: aminotransferase class I/II-fold pyridoxal phosphate-dependent enzyme [Clostridia bacterium]|nr:aminotransferase class I/II-fold pyridoxal phosphate-dependent enzyme [Clostridia bacterium]